MSVWDNYNCEGQMSLFDIGKTPFKITKPIFCIELFAGVGSQMMALRKLESEGLCKIAGSLAVEFDKYAIASYNAIHGTDFPVMDVTKISGKDLKIDKPFDYTYIMTYSFPCTDLSVAGKMQGMAEGSGTRSSLLWEVRRLLDECENLPHILVMENVIQVHSKSNMEHFQKWLDYLESKGYSNYWQDMNAKNYGVAQSRNRTIVISILGDYTYEFPKPYELNKCMKDYLEDSVDEKYYIKNDKARKLIDDLVREKKIPKESLMKNEINMYGNIGVGGERGIIYSPDGISMCESASQHKDPYKILEIDKKSSFDTQKVKKVKQTFDVKNLACEKDDRKPWGYEINVSKTLLTRDYKGFTNYGSNGVIEWQKLDS